MKRKRRFAIEPVESHVPELEQEEGTGGESNHVSGEEINQGDRDKDRERTKKEKSKKKSSKKKDRKRAQNRKENRRKRKRQKEAKEEDEGDEQTGVEVKLEKDGDANEDIEIDIVKMEDSEDDTIPLPPATTGSLPLERSASKAVPQEATPEESESPSPSLSSTTTSTTTATPTAILLTPKQEEASSPRKTNGSTSDSSEAEKLKVTSFYLYPNIYLIFLLFLFIILQEGQTIRGRVYDETKPPTFNRLWTEEEQQRLEQLLLDFPDEPIAAHRWAKIARALGNRTPRQVYIF